METKLYSIPELARILDLHPKTVLRFINEGKLKGAKIGRTWRVTEEELQRYCHGELTGGPAGELIGRDGSGTTASGTPGAAGAAGTASAAPAPSAKNTTQPTKELADRIRVSAVVEITEQNSEEATRISSSLMAMLAGEREAHSGTRFDFFYYPETAKAKYVFYGEPQVIARILETFDLLCAQKD